MGRIVIAVAAVTVIAAAAYAELVLDLRTPRSALSEQHVIGVNVSFLTADYDRISTQMKTTYGDKARTTLDGGSGRIEVHVDDKLVHEEKFNLTLEDVLGVVLIGPNASAAEKFPFDIAPGRLLEPDSVTPLNTLIKNRFAKSAGRAIESLAASDWSTGPCRVIAPDGLGFGLLARVLPFERATTCEVVWKGTKRMQIAVVTAHGDPWMRPFSRRICRTIAGTLAVEAADKPDYAGCVLVDRPQRTGASQTLVLRVFEVGERLASVER